VVAAHLETLARQITQIITAGVTRGGMQVADPAAAARAVLDATSRFHDPVHATEWSDARIDAALDGVWNLVLSGLGAGSQTARPPRSTPRVRD
jgi:hypothetical protein